MSFGTYCTTQVPDALGSEHGDSDDDQLSTRIKGKETDKNALKVIKYNKLKSETGGEIQNLAKPTRERRKWMAVEKERQSTPSRTYLRRQTNGAITIKIGQKMKKNNGGTSK